MPIVTEDLGFGVTEDLGFGVTEDLGFEGIWDTKPAHILGNSQLPRIWDTKPAHILGNSQLPRIWDLGKPRSNRGSGIWGNRGSGI